MSAKWRRCTQCRKVLASEEFDGDSEVCRNDLTKSAAKPAAAPRAAAVTTRVVSRPVPERAGFAGIRGRGDTEVRARRARVRALERLAEQYAQEFDLILRQERQAEGL